MEREGFVMILNFVINYPKVHWDQECWETTLTESFRREDDSKTLFVSDFANL